MAFLKNKKEEAPVEEDVEFFHVGDTVYVEIDKGTSFFPGSAPMIIMNWEQNETSARCGWFTTTYEFRTFIFPLELLRH